MLAVGVRKRGASQVLRGLGELQTSPPGPVGNGPAPSAASAVRPALRRNRTAGESAQGHGERGRLSTALERVSVPLVGAFGGQVRWMLARRLDMPTRIPACRHITCERCGPAERSMPGQLLEGGLAYLQQS